MTRITGPERASLAAQLRRDYEAGQDSTQLAAAHGLTVKVTLTLLREAGTLIRPRGAKTRPRGTCTVVEEDGGTQCGRPVYVIGRSMCHTHYARWWKHGDPLMVLPGPVKVWGEQRAELARQLREEYERYQAGVGLEALGEQAGLSAPTVKRLIEEAGGTTRGTGRHRTYDDATEAAVLAWHSRGQSLQAIARDVGRSVTFVRKLLLRNGASLDSAREADFRGLNAFTDHNRIVYAAGHPGEANPFCCVVDGCNNLAIPKDHFLCAKHSRRLRVHGKLEREACKHCEGELDTLSFSYLCRRCRREGWRYCTYAEHEGERIVPLAAMRTGRLSWCIECQNLESRKRNRGRVCERCGGWLLIRSPARTVCAGCWEGVEGCGERGGECSQPAGRLINGLCMAHYHRARGRLGRSRGPTTG